MPIEFRCTQCQKLLRTGDATAGKLAKCPECGTVVTIPVPGASAPEPAAPGLFEGGAAPPSAGTPLPPGTPFGSAPGPGPEGTVNPYQSPADYAKGASAFPELAAAGGFQPTQIEFGDVFSRTWTIFKERWGISVVAVLIIGGISTVLNLIAAVVPKVLAPGADAGSQALAGVLSMGLSLLVGLIGIWLQIGQNVFFLKVARGQQPTFDDIFSGGPLFLRYLGASILFLLILFAGMLLCVFPYIIFALMFWPFGYLIVDRGLGAIDSLSVAKEITTGNKATVFAIGLVSLLLALPVLLIVSVPISLVFSPPVGMGVGGLIVAPFFANLMTVIYLRMSGQPTLGPAPFAPPPMQ